MAAKCKPEVDPPLPNSTYILGKHWTITYHKSAMALENHGECDEGKCCIFLAEETDIQSLKETLLHEIFHAMSKSLGLELKERQVLPLGCAWYAWVRENPEQIAWILKD